jgi:hypothetical protein
MTDDSYVAEDRKLHKTLNKNLKKRGKKSKDSNLIDDFVVIVP